MGKRLMGALPSRCANVARIFRGLQERAEPGKHGEFNAVGVTFSGRGIGGRRPAGGPECQTNLAVFDGPVRSGNFEVGLAQGTVHPGIWHRTSFGPLCRGGGSSLEDTRLYAMARHSSQLEPGAASNVGAAVRPPGLPDRATRQIPPCVRPRRFAQVAGHDPFHPLRPRRPAPSSGRRDSPVGPIPRARVHGEPWPRRPT